MFILLLLAMGVEPKEPPCWAKVAYAGADGYVEYCEDKKRKIRRKK